VTDESSYELYLVGVKNEIMGELRRRIKKKFSS